MADIDVHTEDDIERLRQMAVLQDAENKILHERIALLSAENEKLREQKKGRLQKELRAVKQHLAKLQRMQFGAKSEKRKRDEERKDKPKRRKERERFGTTPQPDLPHVEAHFELDEPDTVCPKCGDMLEEMGACSEDSEMIDVVERRFVVKQVKQQKYRCRCGHVEAALGPDKLRGTSRYSPEFAIEVTVNKYLDHLPLERQVRRMKREGLVVSSQTLWDQVNRLADHVETTYWGIREWVTAADVMGMDETPWPHIKRGGAKKWQLWAMRGRGAIWYALRNSRSGETAEDLLGDFEGWLMCDALGSYGKAARRSEQVVRLAGCWAHIRRKFIDCEQNRPQKCGEILDLIGELYEVEARARDPDEGWELMECRGHLRATESRAIVERIKDWLGKQNPLPSTAFGKAVNHLREQWSRLTHFVDHPELWIDNNPTERAIRGPVIGRKNFAGCRSPRGMEVAAMLYTIFETAKICAEDPRAYIRRIVEADIRNPHTVTMPEAIQEILDELD